MADGLSLEVRAEAVEDLIKRMSDLQVELIHDDIGEEMLNITQERFDNSMDAFGVPFEPIQAYTYRLGARSVDRKATDPPLKGGLGSSGGRIFARSFDFESDAERLLFGTPSKIAKFYTDFPNNNQAPRKKVKLREYMGLNTDEDIDRIITVVENHIETAIGPGE